MHVKFILGKNVFFSDRQQNYLIFSRKSKRFLKIMFEFLILSVSEILMSLF